MCTKLCCAFLPFFTLLQRKAQSLSRIYMWSPSPNEACDVNYDICPDLNADFMLKYCVEKGSISTIPEIPGVLVFMPGHVGVYIGNGNVIEARGHAYGVVQTRLSNRPWKNWGKCPYMTYLESEDDDMVRYNTISEIPNDWGAQDVIKTLMDAKIIKGDGSDPVGNNDIIDLSFDQVRMLVFSYRGGAFDRQLMAMGMNPMVQI